MIRLALIVPGYPCSEEDPCIPFLRSFAKALQNYCNLTIFALHYPYLRKPYCLDGIFIYPFGGRNVRRVRRIAFHQRVLRTLNQFHALHRFSLTHAFWCDEPGYLATRFAKKNRIPAVVSIIGGELTSFPELQYGGWRGLLNPHRIRFALRNASAITAGTLALVEYTRELSGRNDISYIPPGVDVHAYPYYPRNASVSPPVKLLFVGNLVPIKQPCAFIQVAENLQRYDINSELHIVGDGPLRTEIQKEAIKKIPSTPIFLHGQQPPLKIPRFYAMSDFLVTTSRFEGGPMVALEAGACGTNVVGYPVGVLPDIEDAVLLGYNPSDLADRIRETISEPRIIEEKRERMRSYVHNFFNINRCVEEYLDLYNLCLRQTNSFSPRNESSTSIPVKVSPPQSSSHPPQNPSPYIPQESNGSKSLENHFPALKHSFWGKLAEFLMIFLLSTFSFLDPAGFHLSLLSLQWKPFEIILGLIIFALFMDLIWRRNKKNISQSRKVLNSSVFLESPLNIGLFLILYLWVWNIFFSTEPKLSFTLIGRWTVFFIFLILNIYRPFAPEVFMKYQRILMGGLFLTLATGYWESWDKSHASSFLNYFRTTPTLFEGFHRWSGPFEHANIAGLFWTIGLFLTFMEIIHTRKKMKKTIYIMLVPIWSYAIFMTLSRGALLLMSITVGGLCLVSWIVREYLLLFFIGAIPSFMFVYLFNSSELFRERMWPSSRPLYQGIVIPNTSTIPCSQSLPILLTVKNTGALTWPKNGKHPVQVSANIIGSEGEWIAFDVQRFSLPSPVKPGQRTFLKVVPPHADCAPLCSIRWELVWEGVNWFNLTMREALFTRFIEDKERWLANPKTDESSRGNPASNRIVAMRITGNQFFRPFQVNRWSTYRYALEGWMERPFTGWGMDAFRVYLYRLTKGMWSSNTINTNQIFLEFLFGMGIGALPVFLGLGILCYRFFRTLVSGYIHRSNWDTRILSWNGIILLILVTGFWDFMFGFYAVLFTLWVSLAGSTTLPTNIKEDNVLATYKNLTSGDSVE